jgi:Family of unknown function (DUF6758)
MGVHVSCPRCGGQVRPPDLMHSEWRCDVDGAVLPLHVAKHIGPEIVGSVRAKVRAHPGGGAHIPMWCPWPLMSGWTVTGVGWVGDERSGVRGTVVACSGPAPIERGPADVVLVAEEPGVGLGTRFAGIPGPDPGPYLEADLVSTAAHAKVRADGWPTPLWAVKSAEDRSAYVGEARGLWLYAVAWPGSVGCLLAEDLVLHDLERARLRRAVALSARRGVEAHD